MQKVGALKTPSCVRRATLRLPPTTINYTTTTCTLHNKTAKNCLVWKINLVTKQGQQKRL